MKKDRLTTRPAGTVDQTLRFVRHMRQLRDRLTELVADETLTPECDRRARKLWTPGTDTLRHALDVAGGPTPDWQHVGDEIHALRRMRTLMVDAQDEVPRHSPLWHKLRETLVDHYAGGVKRSPGHVVLTFPEPDADAC
jgi:hypothetical protein